MFSAANVRIIFRTAKPLDNFFRAYFPKLSATISFFGTLLAIPHAMKLRSTTYNLLVYAPCEIVARRVSRELHGTWCSVCYTTDSAAVARHVASYAIDLVVMLLPEMMPRSTAIPPLIADIRASGADIFVLMESHSALDALMLLAAGVRQCMTLPLEVGRLRRKVEEHLLQHATATEVVS